MVLDINTYSQYLFIKDLYNYLYKKKPEFSIKDIIDWYDNVYKKNKYIKMGNINFFFEKLKSVYIIAEAGVNHNGNINIAKDLIDKAKDVGADAVKFQSYKKKKLANENTKS